MTIRRHAMSQLRTGRSSGFTLIECMIVVAIIAILSAIAYPTYLEHLRKGRRIEAKTALLDLASRQERYFTTNNLYTATPERLGYGGTTFPIDVVSGGHPHYRLSLTVGSPATSYSASATPVGGQVQDRCGTFTIDQLGVHGNTDNTESTSKCW
jgi:type IV pilus assembly protein PilE